MLERQMQSCQWICGCETQTEAHRKSHCPGAVQPTGVVSRKTGTQDDSSHVRERATAFGYGENTEHSVSPQHTRRGRYRTGGQGGGGSGLGVGVRGGEVAAGGRQGLFRVRVFDKDGFILH